MSRWQLWQKMTRVLGAMAQVGLEEIGRTAPVRLDVELTEGWQQEGRAAGTREPRRAHPRRVSGRPR